MSRDQLTVVGKGQGGSRSDQSLVPTQGRRMRHHRRPEIDLDELWAPVRRERVQEDREFLPGALEILEAPASPIRIALMYAICALVAAALAWSWFGHLDVYAESTGKFQTSGRTKVVQPQEAGRVVAINARDGNVVKEGDVLLQLDASAALADQAVARDSLDNARAEIARRQTALTAVSRPKLDVSVAVPWPDAIPPAVRLREEAALHSDLATLATTLANLDAQKAEAEAQRDKYKAGIVPQRAVIDLVSELVGMRDELFKNGWNSRATLVTMLQQKAEAQLALSNLEGSLASANASIPVIETQIAKTRQAFVDTNTQKLVDAQQKADVLVQTLAKADLKVANMTLRAPASGTVQASSITTIGQVVSVGQQVMNVVPQDTPMEIEAYILNTDAGFIKVGQEATIKVDTFPYTRYGTISGTVTAVATDALTGKQAQQQQTSPSSAPDGSMSITSAAQQTSDLVFPIIVVPSKSTIMVDGRERPLTSGMTATVEVKTESRRALDYILAPLHDILSSSGKER